MSIPRRSLLVAPTLLAAGAGQAQPAWPVRPIRLVVPYAAGGPSDIIGRLLAPGLSTALGQPVVVENRAGAGSMVGAESVARATDGHTLLLADAPFTILPAIHERMPYDAAADFAPITLIGAVPYILVVHAGFPSRDLAGFLAAARVRPDTVSFASSGPGSVTHILVEWLGQLAGARFVNVAYRGGAPAQQDTVAGQVNAFFASPATAVEALRAGQLIPLGVAAERRVPAFPEVPTLREGGVDLVADNWFGLLAPTSLPTSARLRVAEATAASLVTNEVQARLAVLNLNQRPPGPEAFGRVIEAEFSRWASVARAAGISAR